jgi:hypothetical protein
MAIDLATLFQKADCVPCLPPGQLALVNTLLLNQIATGGVQVSSASFQRPADGNAYAVGDEVSNSTAANPTNSSNPALAQNMVFSGASAFPGGSGVIKRAVMFVNDAVFGGKTFALTLANKPLPMFGDNNPFNISFANRVGDLGPAITFPVQTSASSIYGAGATSFVGMVMPLEIPFVCASGDSNLYAALCIGTVTTPVPNAIFAVDLYIGLQ